MPLLANPALSAALLQLLLQNQAKAQQVHLPLCPLPPEWASSAAPSTPSCSYILSHPPSALSLYHQQAFLGNHLLWAQVLHNKENPLAPCVSDDGVCVRCWLGYFFLFFFFFVCVIYKKKPCNAWVGKLWLGDLFLCGLYF